MSKIERAKKALMSLVGIHYTVEDPEFIPIMPDREGFGSGKSLGELVQELSKYLSDKKEIYTTYTEIRKSNHLVVSLLNKVAIDVLYKGRDRKEPLFDVKYDKDPNMQKILTRTLQAFKVEKHLEEDIFELLLFGEYYLKNDFKNNQLDDCYEYIDILPIYSRGELVECYETNQEKSNNYYGESIDPKSVFIMSLALPGERIKLKVFDDSGNRYYIKIPSPFIIPSTLSLLTSIAIMEKLIPLNQLMKIDKGQMITVGVPPGTPVAQMFEITREYEKQLNSRLQIDANTVSVDDLISGFGRYKCVPVIGDRKATMDTKDLPQGGDIESNDFEYLARTLANRLGVPVSYIFKGIDEDPKVTLLYLLKVELMRERLRESVKSFLINYIDYRREVKGDSLILDPSQLHIMTPAIPGIESLDTVDYADALSATMSNVLRLVNDFTDVIDKETTKSLDKKALIEVLNQRLEPILGKEVFDLYELDKELKDKEAKKETELTPKEGEEPSFEE
ncbi:MAG: hypothetical protein ACTSXD_02015 [Candidatus Heimdallarchaeaceae archaeon]